MSTERHDPASGRKTTGHEWNGIEELDTPIPRVVFLFLGAALLFAIVYWILMPAWPLGWTYTKGLLGIDQRDTVAQQLTDAATERAVWTGRVAEEDFATITADNELMKYVEETGQTLFGDNCAVCHGTDGSGGPGFPDLTANSWLWGGDPETIAETIRVGINSTTDGTRASQMMAFGELGVLKSEQVNEVAAYVRSLSGLAGLALSKENRKRVEAGKQVFARTCSVCHGADAGGNTAMGAPDLTDQNWIYGGDMQSVYDSIYSGRQGQMPHWQNRLSAVDIKILTLYVGILAGDRQ